MHKNNSLESSSKVRSIPEQDIRMRCGIFVGNQSGVWNSPSVPQGGIYFMTVPLKYNLCIKLTVYHMYLGLFLFHCVYLYLIANQAKMILLVFVAWLTHMDPRYHLQYLWKPYKKY